MKTVNTCIKNRISITTHQIALALSLIFIQSLFTPAQSRADTKPKRKKIVAISFKREPNAAKKKKTSKLKNCPLIVCDSTNSTTYAKNLSDSKMRLTQEVGFGGSLGSISESEIEPLPTSHSETGRDNNKSDAQQKPIESYIESIDDSQFDQ